MITKKEETLELGDTITIFLTLINIYLEYWETWIIVQQLHLKAAQMLYHFSHLEKMMLKLPK